MISHVYFCAVLMLAAPSTVSGQCTSSLCQEPTYEPPRWENGAVYLESILRETTDRILSAVDKRLADQTATMESRHPEQSAIIEAHLTQAVDTCVATLKTELQNSSKDRQGITELRVLHELRTLANTTEFQLKEAQTQNNVTIGALIHGMESRLAEHTASMESRLALLTEAVDERLAALKADQEYSTADQQETVEERLLHEIRTLINKTEFQLKEAQTQTNLTVGAVLQGVEERMLNEIRTLANSTEFQLKEAHTQTNVTVGAILQGVQASLTSLCSSNDTNQLVAAIHNSPKAQLLILRLLESRGQVTFLRRVDGSVNFTRDWADYKSGFGDEGAEFWLGLETLHQLTTRHRYGLRADMEDWSGEKKWTQYQSFRVGNETGNYTLTVTGYNPDSTAGDSMATHNGMEFSTYDKDNDQADYKCAFSFKSGWWYNNCHHANPTGQYQSASYSGHYGVRWYHAYNDDRSFKSMALKLTRN